MFNVVESFSGIGSQAKALKRLGIEYDIKATIDWDINAIIAYDFIHHGKQNLSEVNKLTDEELLNELSKFTLSRDGKVSITKKGLRNLKREKSLRLLSAIKRCNNLGSITDVKSEMLDFKIDLFTYSFPCQDLSIAGAWHGNNSGIDRDANNRSGMLWEVERILIERYKSNVQMPKFLLMENVSNILSTTHKENFEEWKNTLVDMGYYNKVYVLNANDFGVPQRRTRAYMLSVHIGNNNPKKEELEQYFANNDLGQGFVQAKLNIKHKSIDEFLRIDYNNELYYKEAVEAQPNDTPSRQRIYNENELIVEKDRINVKNIATITTKQDRNPNSGVIDFISGVEGKSKFRYLTPRECFLFMGFDEEDFQRLIDNDFYWRRNIRVFNNNTLYKLAGNSIVVDVLEAIFSQMIEIDKKILN